MNNKYASLFQDLAKKEQKTLNWKYFTKSTMKKTSFHQLLLHYFISFNADSSKDYYKYIYIAKLSQAKPQLQLQLAGFS